MVVGWFEASGVVGAAVLSALGFLPSCRRRWFMFCAPFWSCFNAFSFFIIGVVCGVKRCLPWLVVVGCCLPWLVGRSFLLVPCISAVSPREGGREGGTTPDERKEGKTPNSNIQFQIPIPNRIQNCYLSISQTCWFYSVFSKPCSLSFFNCEIKKEKKKIENTFCFCCFIFIKKMFLSFFFSSSFFS